VGADRTFVCVPCGSRLEEVTHTREGCASCEEIFNFQLDLRKCAKVANKVVSEVQRLDIEARVEAVCTNIRDYVGHQIRLRNQVCTHAHIRSGTHTYTQQTHATGEVLA
jgi:hypothetical protein